MFLSWVALDEVVPIGRRLALLADVSVDYSEHSPGPDLENVGDKLTGMERGTATPELVLAVLLSSSCFSDGQGQIEDTYSGIHLQTNRQ